MNGIEMRSIFYLQTKGVNATNDFLNIFNPIKNGAVEKRSEVVQS